MQNTKHRCCRSVIGSVIGSVIRSGVPVVAAIVVVAGTGACSSGARSGPPGPAGKAAGDVAVAVTGGFGVRPTLAPARSAAPTAVGLQVLQPGEGPALKRGQVLIARYHAETWQQSTARSTVVADSFDAATPVAMPVGSGQAIKGWDTALVGQKVGSRVLLALPADAGVAASTSASASTVPAVSRALVMVVDLLAVVDADAAASGDEVRPEAAGLPTVSSASGRVPKVTSVGPARGATRPASALLVRGTGPSIDPGKFLVLQLLQVDTVTGKRLLQSSGRTPYVMPASGILGTVKALEGAPVGSRAVSVVPRRKKAHGQILVVDVIAQV